MTRRARRGGGTMLLDESRTTTRAPMTLHRLIAPEGRRRRPVLALLLGPLLLAAVAAPPASAARHAPCPTDGTTLDRGVSSGYNVRVYRTGDVPRVCQREPGRRRTRRVLGRWTPATKLDVGGGSVAWTTRRSTPTGPADAVSTTDIATGRRWLRTLRATPAAGPTAPAGDDRVLRIDTNGRATVWVTAAGAIGVAVVGVDTTPVSTAPELEASTLYGDGAPSRPYREGRVFALGTAGPADALAVARGVYFFEGGDSDECGGLITNSVEIPPFGARPKTSFVYSSYDVEPAEGC